MRRTTLLVAAGLVAPPVLFAAGAWIFYGAKTLPPPGPCWEFLEPSERAVVEDYRSGMRPYAGVCAVILLALIAAVSVERRRAAGWEARLTRGAAGLLLAAVALLALDLLTPLFTLHATLAVLAGVIGGEFVALLAAYSALRFLRSKPASALAWLLAYLWIAVLVTLPALLAVPLQEGTDYFCINGIV